MWAIKAATDGYESQFLLYEIGPWGIPSYSRPEHHKPLQFQTQKQAKEYAKRHGIRNVTLVKIKS